MGSGGWRGWQETAALRQQPAAVRGKWSENRSQLPRHTHGPHQVHAAGKRIHEIAYSAVLRGGMVSRPEKAVAAKKAKLTPGISSTRMHACIRVLYAFHVRSRVASGGNAHGGGASCVQFRICEARAWAAGLPSPCSHLTYRRLCERRSVARVSCAPPIQLNSTILGPNATRHRCCCIETNIDRPVTAAMLAG